jgi:hypothetical protein
MQASGSGRLKRALRLGSRCSEGPLCGKKDSLPSRNARALGCNWRLLQTTRDKQIDLFVLGPAVFPTSATANPTLMIAALSLRTVDPVKSMLMQ